MLLPEPAPIDNSSRTITSMGTKTSANGQLKHIVQQHIYCSDSSGCDQGMP